MDSNVYVPLLSAFGGAIIGSAATVSTVHLQLRSQDRRERVRQATSLALEEFKLRLDLAKTGKGPSGVLPISVLCHFYAEVLAALDRGDLSVKTMRDIQERNGELGKLALEISPLPSTLRRPKEAP